MAKLITGGTGYIGAELAHILVNRGEEVVLFDIAINEFRVEDIKDKVKIVQGDLRNWSEVMNVVKDNKIHDIYHMGSMLTFMSEMNPWASFNTNVVGTFNVLEAARLYEVDKFMFASTMATYGLDMPEVLDDLTIQRPIYFYGCGKLYVEGIGRWYRNNFGLDFRAIRYPAMWGPNVRTPGHWGPHMIEDAIMGKPHKSVYATADSPGLPAIYLTDAARAADMVMAAPKDRIKMVNYCVAGPQNAISVKAVETILKKRYPGTEIICKDVPPGPDVFVIKKFDDSYARKEWGWKPLYDTAEAMIEKFESDIKNYPRRFGLK